MSDNYILPKKKVKAYRVGKRLELGTNIGNSNPPIKLSSNTYLDAEGNVKVFKHRSQKRSDNADSLKKTMQRLGRYIEHNFDGSDNELWITLTYKENVKDTDKVYNDYKAFMKKIRRRYGQIEYISILEPQKRGAWHIHALFRDDKNDKLYIDHKTLEKLWKHGFVWVKKLKHSDNVAAYVTAYLTDIDVNNDDDKEKKKPKKIEKGARLKLYPANMNFYRVSRGIKKPQEFSGMTKHELFNELDTDLSIYAPDKFYEYDIEIGEGLQTLKFQREFYDYFRK